MPQPIYLPRTTNPWEQYLPQFLSSMILQDQSMRIRERLTEKEQALKLQEAGYTTEPPMQGATVGLAPGQEPEATPAFKANLPSAQIQKKPDIELGGKGYYAPRPKISDIPNMPGYKLIQMGNKFELKQVSQAPTPFEISTPEGRKVAGVFNKDGTVSWVPNEPKLSAEQLGRVTLSPPNAVSDPTKHKTFFATDPRVKEFMDKGFIEVKTPPTTVNVNMPDTITPKVKSDLQTKITDADEALDALNQVQDPTIFKREYLEYYGKGKAKLAEFADKAGVNVANEYLANYTGWKSLVDKQTYAYRKAVTGVAGGKTEMEDIQKTYINTSTDSPIMFQAKAKVMAQNTRMAKERARYTLEYFPGKEWKELTPEQKADVSKKFPFITSVTLTKEEVAEQEAEEYLRTLQRK